MSLLWPDNPNDTWTMLTAIVGLCALAAAVWYAATTAQMYRRDHRPMVRMVFSKVPQAVLLKNVGKGTAFGVVMTDVSGHRLSFRSVEAVEPLGEGPNESRRIGRISHALNSQPVLGQTYYLHYQDITGRWHRTTAIRRRGGSSTRSHFFDGRGACRSLPARRHSCEARRCRGTRRCGSAGTLVVINAALLRKPGRVLLADRGGQARLPRSRRATDRLRTGVRHQCQSLPPGLSRWPPNCSSRCFRPRSTISSTLAAPPSISRCS
jgi:hypothetical protein